MQRNRWTVTENLMPLNLKKWQKKITWLVRGLVCVLQPLHYCKSQSSTALMYTQLSFIHPVWAFQSTHAQNTHDAPSRLSSPQERNRTALGISNNCKDSSHLNNYPSNFPDEPHSHVFRNTIRGSKTWRSAKQDLECQIKPSKHLGRPSFSSTNRVHTLKISHNWLLPVTQILNNHQHS